MEEFPLSSKRDGIGVFEMIFQALLPNPPFHVHHSLLTRVFTIL